MWELLLKPVSDIINNIIDKVATDAGQAEKLKASIMKELINADSSAFRSQANIILAEAKGESWIQRAWRPLLMIWFSVLIGAYWFGFTPANLSEPIILKLFSIIQVGIGGYVIGRSGEKMIKEWKK